MSGTIEGGKNAAKTNKERYGDNFYREIGAKGGKLGKTGGFATKAYCDCVVIFEPHFKAQCAGVKGGKKSSRAKARLW